ncbi:MAG: hypothetical protein K2L83_04330 [Muribaculaceae bacterium]|nr:hypothetical protein [Muribaculaceae bacterium]
MKSLGNTSLLDQRKIGYFASGTIAALSVLPTLDWATEVAKRDDVAVVSGFHSKMEREVLDFLLRGKCGIICILARSIYRKIPSEFRETYNAGRVLFIAPSTTNATRASRYLCQKRNEYAAAISDDLVFSSLTPDSSLYPLSQQSRHVTLL